MLVSNCNTKKLLAKFSLLAFTLLVSPPASSDRLVQASPVERSPGNKDAPAVVITGRRLPAAEAPKWAICALLSRDFKTSMILRHNPDLLPPIVQPTRMPRNPDYSQPAKVPVGSPLPTLGRLRFGMAANGDFTLNSANPSAAIEAKPDADSASGLSRDEAATRGCLAIFKGPADIGAHAVSGRTTSYFQMAAEYAMRDRSLPMGFALFDQGRYAEALPHFRHAARMLTDVNGGDEAALFTGKLMLAGFNPREPASQGIIWLKRAAQANFIKRLHMPVFDPAHPELNTASGEAAMILAAIYRHGLYGTAPNMREACRWYERAATVGHVAALKVLGDIYYLGLGVPRSPKSAFHYYRRAAQRHLPAAQVAAGGILEQGDEGVRANLPVALAWYREAWRHGAPDAAYALAVAYDTGNGVKPDSEVALGLYRSAALKGSAPARVALGNYLEAGTIVARDEGAARRWFELASHDGDSEGMFNYAVLLANGRGGPRDLPQAWAWLTQAAANNHPDAPAAIAKLEAFMTPRDKDVAKALVSDR